MAILDELDEILSYIEAPSANRWCKRCNVSKPLSEFQKFKRKEGKGFRFRCKKCQKDSYDKFAPNKSEYHRKVKYGLDNNQFLEMVKSQQGSCKICKSSLGEGRNTHVDHCHKTGKVRGILCQTCNTKLGWAEKYLSEICLYLRLNEPMN